MTSRTVLKIFVRSPFPNVAVMQRKDDLVVRHTLFTIIIITLYRITLLLFSQQVNGKTGYIHLYDLYRKVTIAL